MPTTVSFIFTLLLISPLVFTPAAHAEFDFDALNQQEQQQLLQTLEASSCTCDCGMTVLQCLNDDPTCPVSPKLAQAHFDALIKQRQNTSTGTQRPSAQTAADAKKKPRNAGGNLDQALVGAWFRRTSSGSGIYIESQLRIAFTAEGRIAYGSNSSISGSHGNVTVRDDSSNPAEWGNWHVKGEEIYINWDDGTNGVYPYSVFDYSGSPGLMMQFNGDKRYFKSL